jgi:hypothetical protein
MENDNVVNDSQIANKEKKKLRAVNVYLELQVAEQFHALARTGEFFNKKTPTAVARELIHKFVEDNKEKLPTVSE